MSALQLRTTLKDGNITGHIKYSLLHHNIVIDKFPRTLLETIEKKEKSEHQKAGIYLLTNSSLKEPRIYIGQATSRANGNGLLGRIKEHFKKDFWDTVFLISSRNSWGATELNYLEHTLYKIAKDAGSYLLENQVVPTLGSITQEDDNLNRLLIDEILLILRASGHHMFDPIEHSVNNDQEREKTLHIPTPAEVVTSIQAARIAPTASKKPTQLPAALADAVFRIKHKDLKHPARARIVNIFGTRVGVEVFEGELLPVRAPKKAKTRYLKDLESLEASRAEQVAAGHLDGLKIVKPIEFTSQSAASRFVLGGSSSGNAAWVLESDSNISLGDFLQNFEGSQS